MPEGLSSTEVGKAIGEHAESLEATNAAEASRSSILRDPRRGRPRLWPGHLENAGGLRDRYVLTADRRGKRVRSTTTTANQYGHTWRISSSSRSLRTRIRPAWLKQPLKDEGRQKPSPA